MKLGIMQPYFFPYLGYFDLIRSSDQWIVFDTPQYIRHGWVNRNRILQPGKEWQYIVVPLEIHHRETPINDIRISNKTNWRKKIIDQLQHYRRKAPHFDRTIRLVEESLDCNSPFLSELNVHALGKIAELLKIPFHPLLFSKMNLKLEEVGAPGDWALEISKAIGANEYINPPGGEAIFDRKAFENAGIRLTIRTFPDFHYACRGYQYQPRLSIIDVLMWNETEEIKNFLGDPQYFSCSDMSLKEKKPDEKT